MVTMIKAESNQYIELLSAWISTTRTNIRSSRWDSALQPAESFRDRLPDKRMASGVNEQSEQRVPVRLRYTSGRARSEDEERERQREKPVSHDDRKTWKAICPIVFRLENFSSAKYAVETRKMVIIKIVETLAGQSYETHQFSSRRRWFVKLFNKPAQQISMRFSNIQTPRQAAPE